MRKRARIYNKMMLGALTMDDLHGLIKDSGDNWKERYREFSMGKSWLPIGEVQRRDKSLMIWMQHVGSADVVVPMDSVVKVATDIVTVKLPSDSVFTYTNDDTVELRIRLDFEPFPETIPS